MSSPSSPAGSGDAAVEAWHAVRAHLRRERLRLSKAAAALYPGHVSVEGSGLLARPAWVPEAPVPMEALRLVFEDDAPAPAVRGSEPEAAASLPDARYGDYYAAVEALDPPGVFENRPLYRLLEADLAGPDPVLRFGEGMYFEAVGPGEAAGHEFAAADLDAGRGLPLRTLIGDPCAGVRRCMPLAISALTIRLDRGTGRASFPLHWRDPALVAHAGGLHHVIPAGVFQPAGPGAANRSADFDLWRGLLREYAEELAGAAEITAAEGVPVDHRSWPFAERMDRARAEGRVRAFVLALGVDPLTLAVDLLVAVIFDAEVYDELFAAAPKVNEEGLVLTPAGRPGHGFDAETVRSLIEREPMQPAAAAVLALAVRHSRMLTAAV